MRATGHDARTIEDAYAFCITVPHARAWRATDTLNRGTNQTRHVREYADGRVDGTIVTGEFSAMARISAVSFHTAKNGPAVFGFNGDIMASGPQSRTS